MCRARAMNGSGGMRTQTMGRAHRADTLWDRQDVGSYHTRCDICRAPARATRAGMLLCRDLPGHAAPPKLPVGRRTGLVFMAIFLVLLIGLSWPPG